MPGVPFYNMLNSQFMPGAPGQPQGAANAPVAPTDPNATPKVAGTPQAPNKPGMGSGNLPLPQANQAPPMPPSMGGPLGQPGMAPPIGGGGGQPHIATGIPNFQSAPGNPQHEYATRTMPFQGGDLAAAGGMPNYGIHPLPMQGADLAAAQSGGSQIPLPPPDPRQGPPMPPSVPLPPRDPRAQVNPSMSHGQPVPQTTPPPNFNQYGLGHGQQGDNAHFFTMNDAAHYDPSKAPPAGSGVFDFLSSGAPQAFKNPNEVANVADATGTNPITSAGKPVTGNDANWQNAQARAQAQPQPQRHWASNAQGQKLGGLAQDNSIIGKLLGWAGG